MKGLPELIASYPSSADTLKTLFEIVEQTEMMPKMVAAWRKYITDVGQKQLALVKKDSPEKKLYLIMDEIFKLKTLTDRILQDCFESRKVLKVEQKRAFEQVLNDKGQHDKSAQLLALYINYRLTHEKD